jgi:hypothetical protein
MPEMSLSAYHQTLWNSYVNKKKQIETICAVFYKALVKRKMV